MTLGARGQQGESHPAQQFTDAGDFGLELDIGCVFAVEIPFQEQKRIVGAIKS